MTNELKSCWTPAGSRDLDLRRNRFIRKTVAEHTGEKRSIQSVVLIPNGYGQYAESFRWGYGTLNEGGLRHLFSEFNPPRTTLSICVDIENASKINKVRSGDLPFVGITYEKYRDGFCLSLVAAVIDNLTTTSEKQFGIFRMSADSYSAECQRDAIIAGVDSLQQYHHYLKLARIASGYWGRDTSSKAIAKGGQTFVSNRWVYFALNYHPAI